MPVEARRYSSPPYAAVPVNVTFQPFANPRTGTIRLPFQLAFGEPKGSLMASHYQGECPAVAAISKARVLHIR